MTRAGARTGHGWCKGGPPTNCPAKAQASNGTKIYYHCFVGSFDNTLTWGRVAGTDNQGWFKAEHLDDAGPPSTADRGQQ